MKYERLLGSYYDIALYEYLAEKTEWGQNFYEKLVESLSQALKEDIEMIVLKELGGEPDEFIHKEVFKMSYKGWHNKETYLVYLYLINDSYDWVSYAEKAHLLDLTSAIIDEIHSLVDWIAKYDDDLYWDIIDLLDATIDWEELAEAFQVLADKQAKEHEEKTFAEYLMSLPEEEEEIWEDEED